MTFLDFAAAAAIAAGGGTDYPWPFLGRTVTRLGRTEVRGPRTPELIWSVEFYDQFDAVIWSSAVMDDAGRIFVGRKNGVTAIDALAVEVLWQWPTPGSDIVPAAPAVWQDRVFWGVTDLDRPFVCADAATGEEIWSFVSPDGFDMSPVVDGSGTVYVIDRGGLVTARRAADGELVWSSDLDDLSYASPTLVAGESLLVHTNSDAVLLDLLTTQQRWVFPTNLELFGVTPFHDGRFYIGSRDSVLYAVDAVTGEEAWRFGPTRAIRGAVAIGHDGTVYFGTSVGATNSRAFAVSPEGAELWQYVPNISLNSAPIIDGDGVIYFCASGAPNLGRVIALNPDGSERWTYEMPHNTHSSPMLGPDGTLYVVCRDRRLYAFADACRPDLDRDGVVGFGDVLALLAAWGPCMPTCPADLDTNSAVGFTDLLIVLGAWGPCAE